MNEHLDNVSTDELWDILESDLKAAQDGWEGDPEAWGDVRLVAETLRYRMGYGS